MFREREKWAGYWPSSKGTSGPFNSNTSTGCVFVLLAKLICGALVGLSRELDNYDLLLCLILSVRKNYLGSPIPAFELPHIQTRPLEFSTF